MIVKDLILVALNRKREVKKKKFLGIPRTCLPDPCFDSKRSHFGCFEPQERGKNILGIPRTCLPDPSFDSKRSHFGCFEPQERGKKKVSRYT